MAMTRAQLLAYLVNQYGPLTTLTGQLTTDSATGYGPALDDTFLKLGTVYADLATGTAAEADIEAARLLGRFYALSHFESRLTSKADFDVTGTSAAIVKKRSSALAQIREGMAALSMVLSGYGYTVGVPTGATIQNVRYNPVVPYRTEILP